MADTKWNTKLSEPEVLDDQTLAAIDASEPYEADLGIPLELAIQQIQDQYQQWKLSPQASAS